MVAATKYSVLRIQSTQSIVTVHCGFFFRQKECFLVKHGEAEIVVGTKSTYIEWISVWTDDRWKLVAIKGCRCSWMGTSLSPGEYVGEEASMVKKQVEKEQVCELVSSYLKENKTLF